MLWIKTLNSQLSNLIFKSRNRSVSWLWPTKSIHYYCPLLEIDESVKTRPPVIGPDHSPPTIYKVPQETPATMVPAVTPGNKPSAGYSSTGTAPTSKQQPVTIPQQSPSTGRQLGTTGTSVTPAGVLPTAEAQTGVWQWGDRGGWGGRGDAVR